MKDNVASGDYMWELDLKSGLVWCSDASERVWGPLPEDVTSTIEWWSERIHPADRERANQSFSDTLKGAEHFWQCEYRFKRTDGEYASVYDRAYIARDADGSVERVVGALQDTTQAVKDEASLRAEQRFRTLLLERAAVGAVVIDAYTSKFLQINQRYCDLVGCTREQMTGASFADIYPDDLDSSLHDMARLRAGEIREFTRKKRYVHQDGSIVWVNLVVSPMWRRDETPTTSIAVVHDITDQKVADEALQAAKDRLQFLIADSPTIMYTAKPTGNYDITFVSDNVTAQLGYEPRDFTGDPAFWVNHVHRGDLKKIILEMPTFFQRGRVKFEYRLKNKQGEYRWIYDEPKLVQNNDGEPIEIIGYMIDITERKAAEEALRERDDQMSALVTRLEEIQEAERTAIAREIHDALGQSLTALKLDLALLKDELVGVPPSVGDRIQNMLGTIDNSTDIVRRLASSLRPAMLDDLGLEDAIEWTAQEFAHRSNLECLVYADPIPPIGDERKTAVFRIFQEALTNVVRHARADRIEVSLRAQDGVCTLVVTDDGVGVSDAQLSSSRSLGFLGMRERAARFDGDLDIARGSTGGTVITVHLPLGSPP